MTTTETNGTNGTTAASKEPTAINKLMKEHNQATENGKKPIDKKVAGALLADFKKLLAARDEAQAAFEKATEALSKHARPMVLAFGDKKIDVGGRIYFAASRGETVFYREQGKQDPTDIIKA